MDIVFVAFGVLLIGLIGFGLLRSKGSVRPILDRQGRPVAGAIAEKVWVEINGSRQGMFIRSADPKLPVLLFVHGGPAMPTYFLEQRYPTGLEQVFTVVWWEQRGAGLSYDQSSRTTITTQQIIADTLAMSQHLQKRFAQKKIYVMGHSWGSFIAIQAVKQSPGLFHAYIGVGQITNQLESELLAYKDLVHGFMTLNNRRMVRRLQSAEFEATVPLPPKYMAVRDAAMHRLGVGTMREMRSVITGVFLQTWLNREYSLLEKLNIWRGKWSDSSTRMWNELLGTDITLTVPRLEVPTYFFHGKYDCTTSLALAQAYFRKLEAPIKGFYKFEQSAHSPVYEEADRSLQILRRDVLAGANSLTDERSGSCQSGRSLTSS